MNVKLLSMALALLFSTESQAQVHYMRPPSVTQTPSRVTEASAAPIPGPLLFHGGPVEGAPQVYVVFWGWTSDPSGEQVYLTDFLSSVGENLWLNTVVQYSDADVGNPANLLHGTWADPTPIPAQPTDAQIQNEAIAAIRHFGLGTSDNIQIVVATPTGHSSLGFASSWCAYHGAIAAYPNVTYTNLPYMADDPTGCGATRVDGPLDGVSIVEGHELAETITDPLVNLDDAWVDASLNEIGDKCAWLDLANITTSRGTFAVQPLWSNVANNCVLSTPSVGLSKPVGVIANAGSYPYTFAIGTDGNLWLNYDTGPAYQWANMSKPTSAGIAAAVGVIANAGSYPYTFAIGTDGNLWLNYDTGSAYQWVNMGKPTSAGIAAAVGVIANGGSYPYTFVTGTDGNLWLNYDTGSAYRWANMGKPTGAGIAAAVGVIANAGSYPYTFVTGTDGNLWLNYDTGSAYQWVNMGKPTSAGIAGKVGVIANARSYPYTFVIGTDGNLWLNYYTGSAWVWANMSKPTSAGIAAAVGVIANAGSYPYTFVTGTDGNLWLNYYTGSAWVWANMSKPTSAGIAAAVGVIANAGSYSYTFVTGTDGNLWLNYYTGSAWMWANMGKPF